MANTNSTTITEHMLGKDKKKIKTIDDLLDDSLLLIFSLLSISDKTRCERVCHRWNDLIMHSWASTKLLAIENSICVQKQEKLLNDTLTLTKILKQCTNLQTINLYPKNTNFDDSIFDVIGECCPSLERLILRDADFSRYNIPSIGKSCSKLKSIDLSRSNINEECLWELLHFRPAMESISLSQVVTITGRCFYLCNSLSFLDLSGCSSIVTDAFAKLGQNCSQTLKTLLAPPLTNAGLERICMNFLNLEAFEVESSAEGAISGARLLANLKKLRVLRFYPKLKDLDDDVLIYIMKECPELTKLCLNGTDKLTDRAIANIPNYCPILTALSLSGSQISDDAARALAHHKKLTRLSINRTSITDEGAVYILKNCTSLEFLDVDFCFGVTLKTVLYAWDLVNQGLASKELVIGYNLNEVRPSRFSTPGECRWFAESDLLSSESDEEDLSSSEDDDNYGYAASQYEAYGENQDYEEVVKFDELEEYEYYYLN